MGINVAKIFTRDKKIILGVLRFSAESYGPITLEYLNYAAALGVYSVRYPAVFWSCNKALGTIFSLQLVVNSAQSLLAYAGMSVLYKVSNAKYSMLVKTRRKLTNVSQSVRSSHANTRKLIS